MTDPALIESAREFNRFYTNFLGLLNKAYLDTPFTLTDARVLFEIGAHDGVNAGALARDLQLDSAYLSRILKRFRAKNWLARSVARDDARRHLLALTAAGHRAFAPLEQRSRQRVRTMLSPLAPTRRQRVLDAMRAIERDLDDNDSAPIVLRGHRPGDIGWVVQRHGELYAREYEWNEEFEALVADIAAKFIRDLDPDRERCWIAEREGVRLGCIFLVAQDKATAKLRLLLVEPEARGSGLGKRLIEECIAFSRAAGYRRIVLWTQSNLDAARHLYTNAGFRKTAEESHRSFGKDLVAETWTLKL